MFPSSHPPPARAGYLHIGHAKAMNMNFGFARRAGGKTILRYDDTNPEAEEDEYFEMIDKEVKWLGHTYAEKTYSSTHFETLHKLAVKLIKSGDAYVCQQTPEQVCSFYLFIIVVVLIIIRTQSRSSPLFFFGEGFFSCYYFASRRKTRSAHHHYYYYDSYLISFSDSFNVPWLAARRHTVRCSLMLLNLPDFCLLPAAFSTFHLIYIFFAFQRRPAYSPLIELPNNRICCPLPTV
ncbi:tRNA synthetases class I, catalytic domain-containing protein [Pavlovales sp. CCMP2436]|nr:tRNA synthetases class I, catalytic domain-containing protein [Pavlovales sp. CCMP2436]